MKTSVTVFHDGTTTSTISDGEVSVDNLDNGDLNIVVTEKDVLLKQFYFKSGSWDRYSVIKHEVR